MTSTETKSPAIAAETDPEQDPSADEILKELEAQMNEPEKAPAEEKKEESTASGGWLPSLSKYVTSFSITKDEQDALTQGTRDIKNELDKVGQEFNSGVKTIGGLLGEALGLEGTPSSLGSTKEERFKSCFPDLSETDAVIEAYECRLVQKFRCYHNAILPEKVFNFGGLLFLTVNSAAFFAASDVDNFGSKNFKFIVTMDEIKEVQKIGESDVMKLITKKQVSTFFTGFKKEADFHGAVALIENLSHSKEAEEASEATAQSS
mmetsp:Transcript_3248/g.9928  ORF Transcript_3248/g.9928 Transcript_3248/m.9928 type:complete len:263 (+) Transcript_3248:64-852(+)|eukprot:CAMPEP_0198735642 /NCGR_PEP_ID=MMETSP1475-20131203/61157_1 /TAXON_ID= ORGANISM="Unidentified sp., Strain CCMP1999" /NCGR_SAMPLE_ID=MMETSP1475 /ASSEMBLY_ACC=CAM_ASM_001111 /LENGTH=262 /DNA_ID=CAMNT_0044499339 /DNA_START=74 /DNA_END=862 /DNA_ORIENTATION=-